jgi:hypothetical protein
MNLPELARYIEQRKTWSPGEAFALLVKVADEAHRKGFYEGRDGETMPPLDNS